jgi:hypothetical protein
VPSKQRANVRQDRKARVEAMRAAERARERRQRLLIIGGGAGFAVLIILIVVLAVATKGGGGKKQAQVLPPSVGSGQPRLEAPALQVKDTSGIDGVVAYDTAGYPESSKNGPTNKALPHAHVDGPIRYSVTPPVGGDHNGTWMNCGVYTQPVPSERAVHNLEHGAIWITYQPSLPQAQIDQLKAFAEKQSKVVLRAGNQTQDTKERFMDLTPFPGLSSPIVMSSWGYQLKLTSPTDPRMQKFVDTFRVNPTYTPEYGSSCSGGVGTPAAT